MIWRTFKFLLSTVCFLFAFLIFFLELKRQDNFAMFGAAGAFLFFAAAPWLDVGKPSRALGLAGLVVTIGILLIAFDVAIGNEIYPRKCSGPGSGWCALENILYLIGGRWAASLLPFSFAGATLYGSIIAFKRTNLLTSKESGSDSLRPSTACKKDALP